MIVKYKKDWFTHIIALSPKLLIAILIIPIMSGLASVLLPAFGWIPAINQTTLGLGGFDALLQTAGIGKMVELSITTGFISTLLAFIIMSLILARFFNSQWLQIIERLLSPILVIPHIVAAVAIGFLIAPSGIIARLLAPLMDWGLPPQGNLPNDPYGISIILGFTLKELPFLLLMALGILAQPELNKKVRGYYKVALSLGYYPITAFFKAVFPVLYPLLRLPILAVLAYASASVEIPMVLGPNTPSTLSVMIMQWFNDVDLSLRIKASAGALLQLGITGGLIGLWLLGEKIISLVFANLLSNGKRDYANKLLSKFITNLTIIILILLVLILCVLLLYSIAGYWQFPQIFPDEFTLFHYRSAIAQMNNSLFYTVFIALISTFIASIITLFSLEYEQLAQKPLSRWTHLIIYLPLLIPSIAFLFGIVWLQQLLGMPNTHSVSISNVIFVHILFVLPYVFLSIASSYRRLDKRFAQVALTLGATPATVFFKIKLPQLFAPILIGIALGLAISFSQYLPTLLIGGGRVNTITTDAVAMANGASKRLSSVYAMIQMILPLIGFTLAWILPKFFYKKHA